MSILPAVYLEAFLAIVGTDIREDAIAALIAESAVGKYQFVLKGFHLLKEETRTPDLI